MTKHSIVKVTIIPLILSEASYLDQDALFDAITEHLDTIESQLNVTLGDVSRGEVEVSETESLSVGLIVGIAVASVMVFIALVIGVTIAVYKR